MAQLKILTNGQALVVSTITNATGTTSTLYSDSTLQTSVTLPTLITADTSYYVPDGTYVPYVSLASGEVVYSTPVACFGNNTTVIAPGPTLGQAAMFTSIDRAAVARTASFSESVPRQLAAGSASLTSGTLLMVALAIPAGTTVRTATFLSGSTALATGTQQWFALYNSSRALLGQTANDTNTAWAGNSEKTLTFASPITTTYSGTHYLGILVAATTPPSLAAAAGSATANGLAPIAVGTSNGSLTTTAPDPANALSATANTPYCYVS